MKIYFDRTVPIQNSYQKIDNCHFHQNTVTSIVYANKRHVKTTVFLAFKCQNDISIKFCI